MDTETAIKLLNANSPAAAGARTIIKRALRSCDLPVGKPDEYIRWFIAHPWACSQQIVKRIEAAAKDWTDGNNSGNSNTLEKKEAECERKQQHVETLMQALNVTMDWPGLYPTYKYDGHTYYYLNGLWTAIKQTRRGRKSYALTWHRMD